MRILALATAALCLCAPGMARAQQSPCLTASEFSSLAGYALPSVITGTTKRCATTLSSTSFLRTKGSDLAARYAQRKPVAWPGAKAAFLKLSDGKDDASQVLRSLPDESLRGMIDVILEGMVSQEIPLEKCGTIDDVVRLLAPLPPDSTAELIALTVGLASASPSAPAKVGKINLCKS